MRTDDDHGPPTLRTTLRAGYQKLVEEGWGDVPLSHLQFRCSGCGSRNTDWIVTSRSARGVQP